MFNDFYTGRDVLVIGHTGFKGGWLSLWLKNLGAKVTGLSLPPPTTPNLHAVIQPGTFVQEITCDIRDLAALTAAVEGARPQVVFHLAAQSIVRLSYADPLTTLNTNVGGTAHVLEAIRRTGTRCVTVVVTSDKCYENREWEFAYRENDAMGGHDVYSMSKGAAELVAAAWNRSFFLPDPRLGPVATVRAGNVIGGGDYAPDRLVPDCIRALDAKKPITIRNPSAVRPWQHVLECLSGYLWLAARLSGEPKNSPLAAPFNFGPDPAARQPVRRLVEELVRHWPGQWVDGSDPSAPHEATFLGLSTDKAAALLGWRPTWGFSEAIQRTVAWYRQRHVVNDPDMLAFSLTQIDAYTEAGRRNELPWARAL